MEDTELADFEDRSREQNGPNKDCELVETENGAHYPLSAFIDQQNNGTEDESERNIIRPPESTDNSESDNDVPPSEEVRPRLVPIENRPDKCTCHRTSPESACYWCTIELQRGNLEWEEDDDRQESPLLLVEEIQGFTTARRDVYTSDYPTKTATIYGLDAEEEMVGKTVAVGTGEFTIDLDDEFWDVVPPDKNETIDDGNKTEVDLTCSSSVEHEETYWIELLPQYLTSEDIPSSPIQNPEQIQDCCPHCGCSNPWDQPLEKGYRPPDGWSPCPPSEIGNQDGRACDCCRCPLCYAKSIYKRKSDRFEDAPYRCRNPDCKAEFRMPAHQDAQNHRGRLYWSCRNCGNPVLAEFKGIPENQLNRRN